MSDDPNPPWLVPGAAVRVSDLDPWNGLVQEVRVDEDGYAFARVFGHGDRWQWISAYWLELIAPAPSK